MTDKQPVDVGSVLQLGTGIHGDERPQVVEVLEPLEARLGGLDRSTLSIEAWVKNRGDDDQTVYLALRGKGVDLVAHDQSPDFHGSLLEARNDLRRQLTDHHDKRTKHH